MANLCSRQQDYCSFVPYRSAFHAHMMNLSSFSALLASSLTALSVFKKYVKAQDLWDLCLSSNF